MFIVIFGCKKALPINVEQEKELVFETLQKLDNWYLKDHYLIVRILFPEPEWTFVWLTNNVLESRNIGTTDAEIKEQVRKKVDELKAADLCSENYLEILKQRLNSDSVMNTGMLLTDHEWGDNLYGMLGVKEFLDYLPSFDAEGYNPVSIENENFTDEMVAAWHKRRITFESNTSAAYTLMYTETGVGLRERENAFYIISLQKENGQWKVSDIKIKEVPHNELMELYDKSTAQRYADST